MESADDAGPRVPAKQPDGAGAVLPSEVRPQAAVYMCDACRERVFADGVMTRAEFYAMYDPPAAAVARITEYEEKR
jgi:hypothetical protein